MADEEIRDGILNGIRYHIEDGGSVLATLPWGAIRFANFPDFERYQANNDIKHSEETFVGVKNKFHLTNRGAPAIGISVSMSEGSSFSFVMQPGAEFFLETGPDTEAMVRRYDPQAADDSDG